LLLRGEHKAAELVHRMSVEAREKALGPEHSGTLLSAKNLGSVLSNQGKYEEAEAMHRRGPEGSEKVLGEVHPDTLTSMASPASILWSQRQWNEAEDWCFGRAQARRREETASQRAYGESSGLY
ncbi:hypothetical protein DM02DRAFT_547334, partial [Periconia macrospinosa]